MSQQAHAKASGGAGPPEPRTVAAALALVGLPLLLVALLTALLALQSERESRASIEARAANAAHTASAHVRWVVEANLQALQRIAETVAGRPDLTPGPQVGALDAAVSALPGAVHIWVFDAAGISILNTDRNTQPGRVADREYFTAVRDGAPWHIAPLFTGRLTGRSQFAISRRIEREGSFVGAAVIYVPADLLAQFWASMNLGPGSTVGLIRDDGWLVARYPVPERALNLSGYDLFTKHLPASAKGTYTAASSPADGVGRIVGYQRIEGLPLVTVVGVPTSSLAVILRQRLGEIALVAAPIGIALLFVSLWVLRLLRQEVRARGALGEALAQNRILMREIHHRVKNNLQTVSALIQLQPGPMEAKDDLRRRIAAMAAVHEQIYGDDQFDRLDFATFAQRLVERLREGHAMDVTVACRFEPLRIEADQAMPLSLILNEVVSNAFKHAFPDGRSGRIDVTLAVHPEDAVLTVQDDGVGMAAAGRVGMGSRLIRGLAAQLGGTIETRGGRGTTFVLTFPLGDASRRDLEPQAA